MFASFLLSGMFKNPGKSGNYRIFENCNLFTGLRRPEVKGLCFFLNGRKSISNNAVSILKIHFLVCSLYKQDREKNCRNLCSEGC